MAHLLPKRLPKKLSIVHYLSMYMEKLVVCHFTRSARISEKIMLSFLATQQWLHTKFTLKGILLVVTVVCSDNSKNIHQLLAPFFLAFAYALLLSRYCFSAIQLWHTSTVLVFVQNWVSWWVSFVLRKLQYHCYKNRWHQDLAMYG